MLVRYDAVRLLAASLIIFPLVLSSVLWGFPVLGYAPVSSLVNDGLYNILYTIYYVLKL